MEVTADSGLWIPACRVSSVAHSPQNLKPGGFSNPHAGQRLPSGAAHSPQNFIPPGFSNPHSAHRMLNPFAASGCNSLSPFQVQRQKKSIYIESHAWYTKLRADIRGTIH